MTKKTTPRFDYPKPQGTRSGIKVHWYYYASEADARKASEIAVEAGWYYAGLGYDYGYCSPGQIAKPGSGGHTKGVYDDLWEVTLP